jgi:hypothetical protein
MAVDTHHQFDTVLILDFGSQVRVTFVPSNIYPLILSSSTVISSLGDAENSMSTLN